MGNVNEYTPPQVALFEAAKKAKVIFFNMKAGTPSAYAYKNEAGENVYLGKSKDAVLQSLIENSKTFEYITSKMEALTPEQKESIKVAEKKEEPAAKKIATPKEEIITDESGKQFVSLDIVQDLVNKALDRREGSKGADSRNQMYDDLKSVFADLKGDSLASTRKMYKESDVDPSDWMTKPAVFYCFKYFMPIFDDKRFGKSVQTPYGGEIRFEYYTHKVKKTGTKYDEAIPVSKCVLHSKKETDWMRGHSLFNRVFFEKIEDGTMVDFNEAGILERVIGMVNNMSQGDVISRAQRSGVPMSDDVDKVKAGLINVMVSEQKIEDRRRLKATDKEFVGELS